ncbi:hypothetical protein [Dactylosporangium cerinum]
MLRWAFPVFVVISLSRGGFNSVWAEDGQEFLTDALTLPWYEPFATPFNGYFHTVARACFALIALFPVPWAAALNAGTAAALTAALACLVAAAARDRLGPAAGLVIGASAAVPMGYVPNTLAQLQFPLVYAGLWMLLWTPTTRAARAAAVALPGLAALSSMLGLLLVPVALLRTARRRDRDSVLRALALLPGVALQLGSLLLGGSRRAVGERPDLDPFSVAGTYLRWGCRARSSATRGWPRPSPTPSGTAPSSCSASPSRSRSSPSPCSAGPRSGGGGSPRSSPGSPRSPGRSSSPCTAPPRAATWC